MKWLDCRLGYRLLYIALSYSLGVQVLRISSQDDGFRRVALARGGLGVGSRPDLRTRPVWDCQSGLPISWGGGARGVNGVAYASPMGRVWVLVDPNPQRWDPPLKGLEVLPPQQPRSTSKSELPAKPEGFTLQTFMDHPNTPNRPPESTCPLRPFRTTEMSSSARRPTSSLTVSVGGVAGRSAEELGQPAGQGDQRRVPWAKKWRE